MEDALRPGLLRELGDDGEELAGSIRAVAARVGELLEDAEVLRRAREEAQRQRSDAREAFTRSAPRSVDGSAFSSEQLSRSGYDRYSGGSLREKLGLQPDPPTAPQPVRVAPAAEPRSSALLAEPPRPLRPLPPPPRKGARASNGGMDLLELDAAGTTPPSAQQPPTQPEYDLLDL